MNKPDKKVILQIFYFRSKRLSLFVSQYITLKKGDLIFTGTPEGVGQVKQGDHLAAWLEGKQLLDFNVK